MTKQTRAVASMAELSDPDKKLTAKLIVLLKDGKLDPESRSSINRAINKARRGPNAASPEEKLKYVNGYTTFYKQRFPILKKEKKLLDVSEAGKLIGAEWRALGAEEKQKFKEQAADDRGSA
jgi:hypothetical protein